MSLEIPGDIGRRLATSPKVGAEVTRLLREIADRADQTVPTDTGALRASQRSEVQITPNGLVGLIGYTAFYAHIVHNGSVKRAADPWLLNAALSVMVTNRIRRAA